MAKQVDKEAREGLNSINENKEDVVEVRGKKIKIGWIKPDVNWRINSILDEKPTERQRAQVLHKVSAMIILNNYFKLKFFFPVLWRWFYYVKEYTYEELEPIILMGKKKTQLDGFWLNMAFSVEMMTSWKTTTMKEAEEYRQELIQGLSRHLEKNTDGL